MSICTNSHLLWLTTGKCFMWARTAANASRGPEQLQMLWLRTGKCFMWARTAANASRGPEQLQMLQLRKQDRRQSIAERIFTPRTKPQLVALAANASRGPVQCVRQPAVYCAVQYSASVCSMAQCSFLFLNERTGLHRKSVFLRR